IAPRPDGEADQLQTIELAAGEVKFSVRELTGRHVAVANDLDEHIHGATSCEARRPAGDVSDCVDSDRAPSMHLLVGWHRESVPQPLLQRGAADENGIGWCGEGLHFAAAPPFV